jgi:hypothetical protein
VRNYTPLVYVSSAMILAGTYGYRLENVTVLKDHPNLPEGSQPTRVNIVRDTVSPLFCSAH